MSHIKELPTSVAGSVLWNLIAVALLIVEFRSANSPTGDVRRPVFISTVVIQDRSSSGVQQPQADSAGEPEEAVDAITDEDDGSDEIILQKPANAQKYPTTTVQVASPPEVVPPASTASPDGSAISGTASIRYVVRFPPITDVEESRQMLLDIGATVLWSESGRSYKLDPRTREIWETPSGQNPISIFFNIPALRLTWHEMLAEVGRFPDGRATIADDRSHTQLSALERLESEYLSQRSIDPESVARVNFAVVRRGGRWGFEVTGVEMK